MEIIVDNVLFGKSVNVELIGLNVDENQHNVDKN